MEEMKEGMAGGAIPFKERRGRCLLKAFYLISIEVARSRFCEGCKGSLGRSD
jgi:hypothetical protein